MAKAYTSDGRDRVWKIIIDMGDRHWNNVTHSFPGLWAEVSVCVTALGRLDLDHAAVADADLSVVFHENVRGLEASVNQTTLQLE